MDAEDRLRTRKHLARLRDALKERPVWTNHELRAKFGSRALARINELQQEGYRIEVRKFDRSTWTVEYLGRQTGPIAQSLF